MRLPLGWLVLSSLPLSFACSDGAKQESLSPLIAPIAGQAGLYRLVDPVENPSSPSGTSATASINWFPKVGYGLTSVTFSASASGGGGGPYYYVYAVDICDVNDSCSGFQEFAEGANLTSWTYSPIPVYAAYIRARVQAREDHSPNYLTAVSATAFVRGPSWTAYGGSGSGSGLCGGSFRYQEILPDTSWEWFGEDSALVVTPGGHVHNYRRNWCSGKKGLEDSLSH